MSEDIWHVQLESGEVRQLTLDQLDAFYQNGIIDEETYILQDGEMEWKTLRQVLGLEAEPEPAVPAAPTTTPELSPTPAPISYGAVPSYRPSPLPYSIRPVVSEIDADEAAFDDAMFKKSNKPRYFVAGGIVAAVAVMLAVVGASRMGSSSRAADVTASIANAAPTVTTPATTAQPVIPPPPPATDTAAPSTPKLSDDAKKALATKDSQFNAKQDAKRQARMKSAAPARKSSQPFSKSGNAYDPLNAKL